MSINGRTRVRTLINEHPDAVGTLDWYGIELADQDMNRTLEDLCRLNNVNYWEVKADLISTADDDEEDGFEYDEDEDEDEDSYDNDFML